MHSRISELDLSLEWDTTLKLSSSAENTICFCKFSWGVGFTFILTANHWAATCDFQQCGILANLDSDKPVQPPFKFRNSKRCSVSRLTLIEYSSD